MNPHTTNPSSPLDREQLQTAYDQSLDMLDGGLAMQRQQFAIPSWNKPKLYGQLDRRQRGVQVASQKERG